MDTEVKMGTLPVVWGDMRIKDITFCVTEECNLRCKYCYMVGKNKFKKMSFDLAKQCVDYILTDRENFKQSGVIWNFIGGEPFLEIDLIDKITDYIKKRTYELQHPWFNKYRISISTNGILYDDIRVQNYIQKNKKHISIGFSVDGNKIKHDLQRVKMDGSGSYDDVIKNVPLWLEQFPNASTKATFAHGDIPYLKDSIISLWDNGIKQVAANVVFEDVWDDKDPDLFENQLISLADYIIENKLWEDYSVSFLDPYKGFPLLEHELKENNCGAGKMLAIDCEGKFYPCIRFLDFTMSNKKSVDIGNSVEGINLDKIRPFLELNTFKKSNDECLSCDVATGCSSCAGFDYDCFGTINKKATYICEMHKANVKAINYFWNKLEESSKEKSIRTKIIEDRFNLNKTDLDEKYLIFISSDKAVSHCLYESNNGENVMSEDVFVKGIDFCKQNNFHPVVLNSDDKIFKCDLDEVIEISRNLNDKENGITVYEIDDSIYENDYNNSCIINVYKRNIVDLNNFVEKIYLYYSRINIIIKDLKEWNQVDINKYALELDKLSELTFKVFKESNILEINVLTDIFYLTNHSRCLAGEKSFALAPNGNLYNCPSEYFEDSSKYICNITDEGFLDTLKEDNILKFTLCEKCDSLHCKNCKMLNVQLTGEVTTSSKIQCSVSNLEKEMSYKLQQKLINEGILKRRDVINYIHHETYIDPIEFLKIL